MKNQGLLLIVVIITAVTLSGCRGVISDDRISISQYKGLEVDRDSETLEDDVWEALLRNCSVESFPEEELQTLMEELETQYGYTAYYQNLSAEEWIEELHGMTTEELAKEQLTKEYAIVLIAEKEDLNLNSEDYDRELADRAQEKGFDNVQEYENMFGKDDLMQMFLEERVLNFLMENLK